MPRTFSEQERTYIQEQLRAEAKKCLATYGIRKTTVDELVRRVGIPKGTFYLFYESKERLLFEVIMEVDRTCRRKQAAGGGFRTARRADADTFYRDCVAVLPGD